ncbi:hypothetical protein QOZ80_3BG0274690 [Eleusine coracana subsp. coracana]|nr:hypothetical protein QOZ80_3BG0274690 [Eleusine coracana subsp. coracana]
MAGSSRTRSGDGDAAARRGITIEEAEIVEDDDMIDSTSDRVSLTGEMWSIAVICKGAEGNVERIIRTTLDKANINFVNLISFKDQLGYYVRDFYYYKKRCGIDVATLEAIDHRQDVENMLVHLASEKKIRLVMTKNQAIERHVNITPVKRPRENESDDEDKEDDEDEDTLAFEESIDQYKDWLEEKGSTTDLHDDTREEIIKTYSEWLRDQGHLMHMMSYRDIDNESNGSSATPPSQWPAHARKIKQKSKGGKILGHGTLKGLAAMAKRLKLQTQKLKVEFSEFGGPCGDNGCSFVDEVVMFTRLYTPLIGVRRWKEVHEDVKNSIVQSVMNAWEIEQTDEMKDKILRIEKE